MQIVVTDALETLALLAADVHDEASRGTPPRRRRDISLAGPAIAGVRPTTRAAIEAVRPRLDVASEALTRRRDRARPAAAAASETGRLLAGTA